MKPLGSWLPRWRRGLTVALAVLWAMAFVATHIPAGRMPSTHVSDRVLHVIGFGGLSTALGVAMLAHRLGRARRALLGLAVLATYAAFDELTQPLVARTASAYDWLANLAGAVLGLAGVELAGWLTSAEAASRPPAK